MIRIKAIAFDLGGVLIKENNYSLWEIAQILEKKFGKINNDKEYYERATKETNLSEKEVRKVVEKTIENIYDLREPEIFNSLPNIKLAIASNHLSTIWKWIDKIWIRPKFDCILISGNIGIEKPHREFYERLILELKEKPENILFIDDNVENIKGAEAVWLRTLHYDRLKNLTVEVLNRLRE